MVPMVCCNQLVPAPAELHISGVRAVQAATACRHPPLWVSSLFWQSGPRDQDRTQLMQHSLHVRCVGASLSRGAVPLEPRVGGLLTPSMRRS